MDFNIIILNVSYVGPTHIICWTNNHKIVSSVDGWQHIRINDFIINVMVIIQLNNEYEFPCVFLLCCAKHSKPQFVYYYNQAGA